MAVDQQRESIFFKLVTKEDDYTQLLCNLMKRDRDFCVRVLTLFLGKDLIRDLTRVHFSTQRHLPKRRGRPDLIIETSKLYVIVEVKTEPHRGCTQRQELIAVNGYLRQLAEQSESGKLAALIFLVPNNWKFRRKIEGDIEKWQAATQVVVALKSWMDILAVLSTDREAFPFLTDFKVLLSERFGPIDFDSREAQSMFASDFPLPTILKINAVIEGLRKKAGKRATALEVHKDETGFYLKKGSRLLLYVGCWLAFWEDNHPFPICFGIEDDVPVVKDAFKQAFANAYKTDAILFGEWTMGWVPEEDFTGPDAVERIWSKLEPIWEAVSTATN
jgi:hypothetical protein